MRAFTIYGDGREGEDAIPEELKGVAAAATTEGLQGLSTQ